jgi:site-specific DNA recombinase
VHIWNKTKLVRNPIAKRKEQQPRPESEWERVDVPSWRIVPQELWDAAQEEATRRARSWRQEGGLNRTPTSRQYLFSGLMVCAECGSNFNIIDGKVSSLRYGCIGHRYRGTCQNKLTILRRTLEEQMLQALKDNILRPEIRVQLCADFHAQVRVAWEQSRQQSRALAADSETLRQRQRQLQDQADNLVDAIAKTGGSSLIYERLQSVELQLNQVAQLLTLSTEVKQDAPNAEEIQGFFERVFAELDSVMTAEPELAKQTLRKYMGKLVMRAIPSATSPKYEVSGDLRLFASEASQDTVLLEGSVHRTMQQYEDWRVPFFTVLNAKSTRQRNRSRVDGRFLSDVDEGSDDAEELGGMNAAPWNEDVPSQTYLIAGMETSNNLVSSLLE